MRAVRHQRPDADCSVDVDRLNRRRVYAPVLTAMATALAVGALFGAIPATAKTRAQKPNVSVRMEVSSEVIEAGDSFQLDVVLTAKTSAPVEELSLPDLSDFRVLRDHRSTVKSRKRNGRKTYLQVEHRYTYLLTSDTPGRKRIGGVRARIGSDVAKAKSVTVTVTPSSRSPLPRDTRGNPTARPGEELPPYFYDMRFDREEAYVGEGVTLTARLFATTTVSGRALDSPQWSQFWVEDLGGHSSRPTTETMEGKRYYVYTVSRKAMFPLEAGDLVIPAMSMQVETGAGVFGRGRSMVLRSDPATLKAKALPAKGRRETFTLGNVGQWKLTGQIHPRRAKVGEAVTLRVTASGFGNIGQLTLPSLEVEIPGARVFKPNFGERKSVEDGKLAGVKTVEALVQPTRVGRLQIPAFHLDYFDPKTGRYARSTTRPMSVSVSAATETANSGTKVDAQQRITAGARPVHLGLTAAPSPRRIWPAPVGAGLGFLTFLALTIAGRKRRSSRAQRQASASRAAKTRRKSMDAAGAEKDLGRAGALVMDALADRVGEAVRALPSDEMEAACRAAHIDEDRARALTAFFDAVDAVRFTPGGAQSRQQLFDEGAHLLRGLDEEWT